MGALTVAKKPQAKKPESGKAADGGWTTFRLYAEDGEALSDLAKEEKVTIADLYRELLAPIIKERLIRRTEEKLKKMKGG